jgi:lysozyme
MQAQPPKIPSQRPKPRALATIVGVAACAALLQFTPTQEGTVYKTYKDLGGVLTYCTGATEDAIAGKIYTPAECRARLDYDLAVHADGISKCMDLDRLTVGQKVAFVDTAYNIGVAGFCGSSMVREAKAGNMRASCDALMRWVKVGGKTIHGLVNRRTKVHAFCMVGVV